MGACIPYGRGCGPSKPHRAKRPCPGLGILVQGETSPSRARGGGLHEVRGVGVRVVAAIAVVVQVLQPGIVGKGV
eukprot:6412350-Alexandrium_andersonii.AAC.1